MKMQLLSFNMPLDWNLFLFGDDHVGASLRHDKGWQKLIDMMHSAYGDLPARRNFGVHHGDLIEAIMVDDKRFSFEETRDQTVIAQIYHSIKALTPIKEKILTVLDGNHPRKLLKFGPITRHICKELNVQYGTWAAKLVYNDMKGDLQFKHFATHGAGTISSVADDPARQKTNMHLSLKRKLKKKFGDVFLASMGHTHKLLIVPPTKELYLTDDGKKVHQNYTGEMSGKKLSDLRKSLSCDFIHHDFRWYVNTGSFLKLFGDEFSGYAEIKNYDPIELGFAVAKIRSGVLVDIDKIVV